MLNLVVFSLVAFAIYKVFSSALNPPKELQNIPTIPILKSLLAAVTRQGFDTKYWSNVEPVLREHGIAKIWFFGLWVVVIGRSNEAKKILNDNRNFPKFLLSELAPKALITQFFSGNIVYSNEEVWRKHRKIVFPGFQRSWSTQEMGKAVLKMFEEWKSITHQPLDIPYWNQKLTLDILGTMFLGIDFNAVQNKNSELVALYNDTIDIVTSVLYIFFPFLDMFRAKSIKRVQDFDNWLLKLIEDRRQQLKAKSHWISTESSSKLDTLSVMVKACYNESDENYEHEEKITPEELLSNLRVFLLAGHDTTSSSLSSALYHLALCPEIQDKVREEVQQIVGAEAHRQIPTTEQLQEMKYLNMVIKESMRIAPPLGVSLDRTPLEPTEIMGHLIPPKTMLWVHIYHVHHDARHYSNPNQFDPMRFAPENERLNSVHWIPFSSGVRQCPGMTFSLLEQKLVLAMVLSRYIINFPVKDSVKPMTFKANNLLMHRDLKLKLTPIIQ